MPQDVVVVFVHGINVTNQKYYEPLRDRILRFMPKGSEGHVIFRAVFWADLLRGRQQEYLKYAEISAGFVANGFHRMVIEGLGDAASYQKTEKQYNSAYYQIQERVRNTICDAALPGTDLRPLVIIGHSLGCHIASSYAWDLHKIKGHQGPANVDTATQHWINHLDRATAFERLDTFAGFITMGSNMPLFTFTFGPQYVYPITKAHHWNAKPPFPGPQLDDPTRARAFWHNYYSVNDPLGYPMKPLNDAYDDEPLLKDHQTVSEGWWRSKVFGKYAMLEAHQGYWTDTKVARGAAGLIEDLVFARDRASPPGPGVTLFG
jgi:hypothetical protein